MTITWILLSAVIPFAVCTTQMQTNDPNPAPGPAQLETKRIIKWIMIGSEREIPSFLPDKIKTKIPPLLKSQFKDKKSGAIIGTVSDLQKRPLLGATIEINGHSMPGVRTSLTDKEGMVTFIMLPPGSYACRIFRYHYINKRNKTDIELGELTQSDIRVAAGKVTVLEAALAPAAPEVVIVAEK